MNVKPPPPPPFPPPPQPGGEPWGDDEDGLYSVERPSAAGVVALGLLNVLFALVCGCAHGSLGTVLEQVNAQEEQEVFGAGWDEQLDTFYAGMLDNATSQEERDDIERQRAFMKSDEVKEAFLEACAVLSTSDMGKRLQQASMAAVAVQLLMLLSGVLLLTRARISRSLGLAATFLTMLVQVTVLVFLLGVVDELELAVEDRIVEAARQDNQNLDPAARDLVDQSVSGFVGESLRAGAVVTTILAILYPLLAFLFLLFSRGVRRALEDDGRALRPDVF